jgi:hypothetical protein
VSAAPRPEPGTDVARSDAYSLAMAQRDRMRAVQREIRNKSWGKDLPDGSIKAIVLWAEKRGLDAATEVDVLGGNIHIKGTYYLRRLAHMIGDDLIEYAYPDHIHVDPRLTALADDEAAPTDLREEARRELYRRQFQRARHNLKDEAAACVVYRVKLKSMAQEVTGAKCCGNGVRKNDPVGDASPAETCETRAARRACRQVIDTFPDLKAEMDVIEAEAKLVGVEIIHGHEAIAAEAARPGGLSRQHVRAGDGYDAPARRDRQVASGEVRTEVIDMGARSVPQAPHRDTAGASDEYHCTHGVPLADRCEECVADEADA